MRDPCFLRVQRIAQNFAAVELRPKVVRLNKPIAMGQAVLDVSKAHMYAFHHGVWRPAFGERSRLLFTDTDSLAYEVRGIRDMSTFLCAQGAGLLNRLDTAGYPEGHLLRDPAGGSVAAAVARWPGGSRGWGCCEAVADVSNGLPFRRRRRLSVTVAS